VKQLQTTGIVLTRTNYGEADRIITLLTPDHGKLRLMAKGVRRAKSKLAGGIELFSIIDITFIQGTGEIGTLISTRLKNYYGNIVKDIGRVQLGYNLIKILNKATEDHPESEYFSLLEQVFAALDDFEIDTQLIRLWFEAQLLKQAGHSPNLSTDTEDQRLRPEYSYSFSFDDMAFTRQVEGNFTATHIKTLRLLFSQNLPSALSQVHDLSQALIDLTNLIHAMLTYYIRV